MIAISCSRTIARPPAEVFAFLSDLRNHWPLLGKSLVDAQTDADQRHSVLTVRIPVLGLHRRIDTRVDAVDEPSGMHGEARAGWTSAAVEWRISPAGGEATGKRMDGTGKIGAGPAAGPASQVRFTAAIEPGNALDALLVRLARSWLRRRCDLVLNELAVRLEAAA